MSQKRETESYQVNRCIDTILVLEEDTSLCKMIQRRLAMWDIAVTITNDVDECLTQCSQSISEGQAFAGAILDLNIAGEEVAVETLQKLKKMDPEIKAVVTSGSIDDETMINYKQYGFQGALAKPFEKQKLVKILRDALQVDLVSDRPAE